MSHALLITMETSNRLELGELISERQHGEGCQVVTPLLSTPLGEKSEETADVNISSEDLGEWTGNPGEAAAANLGGF